MQLQRKIQNLLVTGGCGFIGSAFIRYVLKQNFQGKIINLDALTYAGNVANLEEVEKDPRYVFVKGDIRNQGLVEHLCEEYDLDAIIHFAAESHVDRSILGPQAFMETNVMGTFHLMEAVRKHPHVHFHHVSTDEVYGHLGDTGFFTETTAYHPNSPYSASKACSDHIVRSYGTTYGISTCVTNCSNNYGPYHFPEKLIPLMLLNCINRKPLPVYGAGTNVRDWLYVEDHAEALWLVLQYGRKGETYNIGGEEEWRNIDLVHLITEQMAEVLQVEPTELKKLITFVKDRPGHDFRYAIDCSKIKQELGWKPSKGFEARLKETINWYMSNQKWVDDIQNGSYQQWIESNYVERA